MSVRKEALPKRALRLPLSTRAETTNQMCQKRGTAQTGITTVRTAQVDFDFHLRQKRGTAQTGITTDDEQDEQFTFHRSQKRGTAQTGITTQCKKLAPASNCKKSEKRHCPNGHYDHSISSSNFFANLSQKRGTAQTGITTYQNIMGYSELLQCQKRGTAQTGITTKVFFTRLANCPDKVRKEALPKRALRLVSNAKG